MQGIGVLLHAAQATACWSATASGWPGHCRDLYAGSALVMWLGEQITEMGIGNGISIILFAGIVSRIPSIVTTLVASVRSWAIKPGIVLGNLTAAG